MYVLRPKWNRGFTLTEILIVVAILIVLILLFLLTNWKTQVTRGYDSKRKGDLQRIRTAFEDYYNDHNCYPAADILANCGGTQMSPYLAKIPCDPVTKIPYQYVPFDTNDLCKGYRILTTLGDTTDPAITQIGCSPSGGCGFVSSAYNWGVSSGALVNQGYIPTPGAGTPAFGGGYACAPGGSCNSYSNPTGFGCPITFADEHCSYQCGNPANWCRY